MKKTICIMILVAAVLAVMTGCAAKSNAPETEYAAEVSETIQNNITSAGEKVAAAMETINAAEKDQRYKTIQSVADSLEEAKEAYVSAADACADYESLADLKASIEAAVKEFPASMPLDVEFGINRFLKTMDKFVAAQGVCEQKAAELFQ